MRGKWYKYNDYICKKEEKDLFELVSNFKPTGDQPKAIEKLVDGINRGEKFQTLIGVTGSRKDLYNGEYN